MTDRELLELAAKAAGIEVRCGTGWESDYLYRDLPRPNSPLTASVRWNPLDDDGDALRLAHMVPMIVTPGTARLLDGRLFGADTKDIAATRRAIVGAAAEFGRAMP